MDWLAKFSLRVLEGMRAAVAGAVPDEQGMIWETISNVKRSDPPFRISTNKAEYLALIEAAIARRSAAAGKADE